MSDQVTKDAPVETDFLIVGAGPAGASLACFLTSYGLRGIMISGAPGTAHTPRAHITNMAAMECLRDIGLEEELLNLSSEGHCMIHTRWGYSMAGEEFARIHSWGNDPKRKGDYETASPCSPVDLPQSLLEPALVRHAVVNGFKSRFDTSLQSFETDKDAGYVTSTLEDKLSKSTWRVKSKYLFGADGARSLIVKTLELPMTVKPGQGVALNVLVEADLSHLIEHRPGNLHWVMQPDKEHPAFGWMGLVRMVKPWHEWMFIIFPNREWAGEVEPTQEEYMKRVREFIGDDTPAKILNVSKWVVNETVADVYSKGNVFCLGDAVHRHPPFNGLGSNTCIQDSFNLAWKIAHVHKGIAHPSLLDTYSSERQPVGLQIVTRANQGFRDHLAVWEALGMLPEDVEERRKLLNGLDELSKEGTAQRKAFRDAIKQTEHEFHALGTEMGQVYSSPAIYGADEASPYEKIGRSAQDAVLYHEPSTYPGCRLPHVWLNKAIPDKYTSTIDLAGHGAFSIFTGPGGNAWKKAAEKVSKDVGVKINVYSIGYKQDWEDVYSDWDRLSGVEEDGAVLARPDRFVAWRAANVSGADKLKSVIKTVLGYKD